VTTIVLKSRQQQSQWTDTNYKLHNETQLLQRN